MEVALPAKVLTVYLSEIRDEEGFLISNFADVSVDLIDVTFQCFTNDVGPREFV